MANDKNEDQKEEETKTLQEKYDELLEELDSKNKELAKINEDLEKQKEIKETYHDWFRLLATTVSCAFLLVLWRSQGRHGIGFVGRHRLARLGFRLRLKTR